MHAPLPSIAVVGAGAIGTALVHACRVAGIPVVGIASRTARRAEELAEAHGSARAISVSEAASAAPVVILSVSDAAIETVATSLETNADTIVAHTSGFRGLDALSPLQGKARIGSMHPLAAVARGETRSRSDEEWRVMFAGGAFALEGDDSVRATLGAIATALGALPFHVSAEFKARYHLGASMLAAFSASLAQVAWQGMREAGADDATASTGVGHLLETVGRNVSGAAYPFAVSTGPIARADADGVLRQARAAASLSPAAASLYLRHAAHAIDLAVEYGKASPEVAAQMTAALARSENEMHSSH